MTTTVERIGERLMKAQEGITDRALGAIEELECLHEIALDLCDQFESGRKPNGLLKPESMGRAIMALARSAQRELGFIHDAVVSSAGTGVGGDLARRES